MEKMHPEMPHFDAHAKGKEKTLAEISVTNWLTPQNSSFFQKNGLLYIRFDEKETRVLLCREFPFEMQWEFISVMDEDEREVGIIRNVELFEGEDRELLFAELKRRYYVCVIERILKLKEKYGFSYWKVHTADGEVNFTMRDTYRNILRVGEERLLLLDVDGNRFEIPDVRTLDRKSYKKIELYL